MRFHALLPVRDESDIIGQSLHYMLTWADAIYVFDTGSVDNTWEIVREFAERDKRVIPLKKQAVYYSEPLLRGWMFHQARQQMRQGDWFLRVDADEFHHIPPPEFVRNHLRSGETIVWHQYYDFCLTASEAKAWDEGKENLSDRRRPIEQRRQHFTVRDYSEPRLCRYRESMRWPETYSFPVNAGYVARERLPIRHYAHRDPEQLKRRVCLRAIMLANCHDWVKPETHHWSESEWRQFIVPDDSKGLYHWKPGSDLPRFNFRGHLKPVHIRTVQKLIHSFCLPALDHFRPKWSESAHPPAIPSDIVKTLERELAV